MADRLITKGCDLSFRRTVPVYQIPLALSAAPLGRDEVWLSYQNG